MSWVFYFGIIEVVVEGLLVYQLTDTYLEEPSNFSISFDLSLYFLVLLHKWIDHENWNPVVLDVLP